jgi:hypothetical protein
MNTTDHPIPPSPALKLKLPTSTGPLARLVNLIARGHWSVKHYGPTLGGLFLGAQEDLVKEHQLELSLAADGAATLDGQTKGYAAKFLEFLTNDGVIDPREASILSRLLRPLTRAATTHATTLKRLAE